MHKQRFTLNIGVATFSATPGACLSGADALSGASATCRAPLP